MDLAAQLRGAFSRPARISFLLCRKISFPRFPFSCRNVLPRLGFLEILWPSLAGQSWLGLVLPKIYHLFPCFLPAQNQMGMVPHASNSQHQMLARHWRSWRDMLEGLLQSPAVNQGSGGIRSCIRDALRHNSCQPLELEHVSNPVLQIQQTSVNDSPPLFFFPNRSSSFSFGFLYVSTRGT